MDVWWGTLLPQPPENREDPALERISQLEKKLLEASHTIDDLRSQLEAKHKETEDAEASVLQLRELLTISETNTAKSDSSPAQVGMTASTKHMAPKSSDSRLEVPNASAKFTTDKVLWSVKDNLGVVIMNDPKKLNCLSNEMLSGILTAFDNFEAQQVRAVIIRAGPGVKVWSAGHDVNEFKVKEGDDLEPFPQENPFQQVLIRVRNFSVPVIGAVQGSVWGGACDLAACCDMLVGTPSASFAVTPAKMGVPYCTSGVSHFLGVLPLHIVKQMFFTAEPITADQAHHFGLLNQLVSADKLDAAVLKLAKSVASRAPLVVKVVKAELQQLTSCPGFKPDEFESICALRRQAYRSNDRHEGLAAFLGKRPPDFTGQ